MTYTIDGHDGAVRPYYGNPYTTMDPRISPSHQFFSEDTVHPNFLTRVVRLRMITLILVSLLRSNLVIQSI